MRNERGILTLDFLFSLILVLGMTGVLFALSFTLSIVEMTQYVAFATARSYYAGHISKARQEEAGNSKFNQLIKKPGLVNLLNKDWFVVTLTNIGNFSSNYPADEGAQGNFQGALLSFNAKLLDFQIPLYGSTTGEDGKGFTSKITAFIGREPSTEECMNFMRERYTHIRNFSKSGGTAFSTAPNEQSYVVYDDNGC